MQLNGLCSRVDTYIGLMGTKAGITEFTEQAGIS